MEGKGKSHVKIFCCSGPWYHHFERNKEGGGVEREVRAHWWPISLSHKFVQAMVWPQLSFLSWMTPLQASFHSVLLCFCPHLLDSLSADLVPLNMFIQVRSGLDQDVHGTKCLWLPHAGESDPRWPRQWQSQRLYSWLVQTNPREAHSSKALVTIVILATEYHSSLCVLAN